MHGVKVLSEYRLVSRARLQGGKFDPCLRSSEAPDSLLRHGAHIAHKNGELTLKCSSPGHSQPLMLWAAAALRSRAHRFLPACDQSCRGLATRIGKLGKLPEKVSLLGVKAAVAIASGKGGVGKSTTTGAHKTELRDR